MSSTTKGYLCGVVAAVSYGTNPLGALWLYEDGLTPNSVLLYRFAVGAVLLALMLAARRTSFALTVSEAKVIGALGLLFAASSITYYYSFKFMAAGLASTILFFYPVMVAVIMAVFYGERVTRSTVTAILLSLVMMAVAVKHVGSTPTAIMGALEPLTAVLIGVGVFGETLTPRLAAGIMLILSAVIIIVVGRRLSVAQVTAWVNRMGRRVVKHWRWR